MIVDDWEVQIEDKPAKGGRIGHEISDDYDRETSVIQQVLAAAVKRREEVSKKQGGNQYGGQVSLCALNVLEIIIKVSNLSTIDETAECRIKEALLSRVHVLCLNFIACSLENHVPVCGCFTVVLALIFVAVTISTHFCVVCHQFIGLVLLI